MNAIPPTTTTLLETNTGQPPAHAATPPVVPYVLPTPSAYKDWAGCQRREFLPTERQRSVIEAVQAALDTNLFYTDEVREFCAQRLCITAAQAHVRADKVEGGEFGMDCYYARGYLKSRQEIAAEDAAYRKLAPRGGLPLGTLMFNDYKRNTGMVIEELLPEGRLKLRGKRGRYVVTLECTALSIGYAIDRAAEHGLRKDRFDTLTLV
jgi:hypothetical protein